jgi:hypothetical protein
VSAHHVIAVGAGTSRRAQLAWAVAVSICLLLPSIWLLATVPPLWKDVDAYVQVTYPRGVGTLLHFPPLYCFAARIPLFLGYLVDVLSGSATWPNRNFATSILTDHSVFALLVCQHAALFIAQFYLVVTLTVVMWKRLLVALACSANPLFYAFAQCVGSDALSMILTLAVSTLALRIVRSAPAVNLKHWGLFAFLLLGAFLTRHLNNVLAALLPICFLILLSPQIATMVRRGPEPIRSGPRSLATRQMFIAVAVGLFCIIAASMTTRLLCVGAHITYRSRVGMTFLWRLRLLSDLPFERQEDVLDRIEKQRIGDDIRLILSHLREALASSQGFDPAKFAKRLDDVFMQRDGDSGRVKLDRALNGLALAFFKANSGVLGQAALRDFIAAQKTSISEVIESLFATTNYISFHRESMPALAKLHTFRDFSPDELLAICSGNTYLQLWRGVPFARWCLLWLVLFILVFALAARRSEARFILAFALAAIFLGELMMFANCLLTEFRPRYVLPMFELTFVSILALFAQGLGFIQRKPTQGSTAPASRH